MNYYPIRLQAAFFLAAIDFSSKFKIANLVREKAGNLLQVDPLLLPLPVGSPPEFPHIVIRNEGNGWSFQMAPARFDLIIEQGPQPPHADLDQWTDQVSKTALVILHGLQDRFGARVNRVGLVTSVVAEVENAPEVLRLRYLGAAYGNGAHESQLHILHKLETEGLSLNRWVRLRALPANDNWPSRLVLEADVNTVPEQPIQVTEAVADSFLSVASRLTRQSLGDYLSE
jgi:hypothetical protein